LADGVGAKFLRFVRPVYEGTAEDDPRYYGAEEDEYYGYGPEYGHRYNLLTAYYYFRY
jgi:hypothetical protein